MEKSILKAKNINISNSEVGTKEEDCRDEKIVEPKVVEVSNCDGRKERQFKCSSCSKVYRCQETLNVHSTLYHKQVSGIGIKNTEVFEDFSRVKEEAIDSEANFLTREDIDDGSDKEMSDPTFCSSQRGLWSEHDKLSCKEIIDETESPKEVEDLTVIENLVKNLPEVPKETEDGIANENTAVDIEIEARLMKLKIFNRSWSKKKVVLETSASQIEANHRESNEIKVEKTEPVFSSHQDREDFNSWYDDKVKRQNRKRRTLKVELKSRSVSTYSDKFDMPSSTSKVDMKASTELNKQDCKLKDEELDMVTFLCGIQANTVAMVATVFTFIEKLDNFLYSSPIPTFTKTLPFSTLGPTDDDPTIPTPSYTKKSLQPPLSTSLKKASKDFESDCEGEVLFPGSLYFSGAQCFETSSVWSNVVNIHSEVQVSD